MLPLPFSTTCAFRLVDRIFAALTRSACTSAVCTASRRAASAGCGVSSVSALRRAHCLAQPGILRNQVEGVGVEHAGQVARERRGHQRLCALAVADARADHQHIEILAERIVGMAQHQFEVLEIRKTCSSSKPT
jgi:hypothetical protein